MKLVLFALGFIGVVTGLAGSDRLVQGGRIIMSGQAAASDAGTANRTAGTDNAPTGHAPAMPPARDPSAAVAEEYEAARRSGTREAFELFIARHGDDPLAAQARSELGRLPR